MNRHQWNLSQIQLEALRELPIFTERVMFECKQGWYNLIYDLGSKISGYCIHNNIPIPDINQIKEKFGTLRFYYLFKGKEQIDKIHLDIIKEWVNTAERNSENICEYCGEPGKLFVTCGLWEVLCDNHKRNNALTVEEYRIEQAILQKARRKCNVCGVTNVDMYFDGNQVAGYCEDHKKDFITADLYYDQMLANYNKQNRM